MLSLSSLPLKRALIGLLLGAADLAAQPVIGSAPEEPSSPPVLRPPATGVTLSAPPPPVFRWGSFVLRPHIRDRFIYSDGLRASADGRSQNSYVNTLSPGFNLDLGRHWTADYTASWTTYSNRHFRDTLNHAVNLAGATIAGTWALDFSQSYRSSDDTLVETARQTAQENASTQFGAIHRFGGALPLSLHLSVNQSLRFIESSPDVYDWSTSDWLQYDLSPKLALGVGATFGYTDLDPGDHMKYSSPQVRITWRPTAKIALSATAGNERRQFRGDAAPPRTNTIYNGTLAYAPFEHTQLGLTASRAVGASYFTDQINVSRGWGATFSQRLLQHFTLNAGYNLGRANYVAIKRDIPSGRADKTHSYHVRLSTTFLRRGSIALLYQGTNNKTNRAGYAVDSRQMGIEIGYRY